jgi:hypothetical protein
MKKVKIGRELADEALEIARQAQKELREEQERLSRLAKETQEKYPLL